MTPVVMSDFGPHQVSVQGDAVFVTVHGDWPVSGMVALLELLHATQKAHGTCYTIVDTTDGNLPSAEVRKAIGDFVKRTSFRPTATWVIGATFGARAVLKLVNRVVTMLTGVPRETFFVDTLQEAKAALERLRRSPSGVHPPH